MASSENVKNLPKAEGGPGMTRAELEAKKAQEATAAAQQATSKSKID